jgi:hypothetical protein
MPTILTTPLLTKVRLSLREATPEEILRIKKVLESNEAKFEFVEKEEACALLDKHNTIKE